eukprot:m.154339 g.154339  ORF g.154339 m.154339 type:complete len:550 (+) comp14376_c0_seq4:255-1904(+)
MPRPLPLSPKKSRRFCKSSVALELVAISTLLLIPECRAIVSDMSMHVTGPLVRRRRHDTNCHKPYVYDSCQLWNRSQSQSWAGPPGCTQPLPRPNRTVGAALSAAAAHEWVYRWLDFMCCSIVEKPMPGVASAIWSWKMACTDWAPAINATLSSLPNTTANLDVIGNLSSFVKHCPSDIVGGRFDLAVGEQFAHTFRDRNVHTNTNVTAECNATVAQPTRPGTVSVMLYGAIPDATDGDRCIPDYSTHLSLLVRPDGDTSFPAKLTVPSNFLSLGTQTGVPADALTGTLPLHAPWGLSEGRVSSVIHLHGADVDAAMAAIRTIQSDSLLSYRWFDRNCGWAVYTVLKAAFGHTCSFPAEPDVVFPAFVWGSLDAYNVTAVNSSVAAAAEFTVDDVRAEQVTPEEAQTVSTESIPVWVWPTAVAIILVVAATVYTVTAWRHTVKYNKLKDSLRDGLATSIQMKGSSSMRRNDLTAMIAKYDVNQDGQLDRVETAKFIRAMKPGAGEREVNRVFAKLDDNGDGFVSVDELENFFCHHAASADDRVLVTSDI